MIGVGTGIAPFRAFTKHIYGERGGWKGKVRLFYGARTGMDLLYMNDRNNDISSYYDEDSFKAFESLSPRPHFDEPAQVERSLKENAEEVWSMLQDSKTHAYVSGLSSLEEQLDDALADIAGSPEDWVQLKKRMIEEGRWSTLFYE
jgi:ferredoxin--NADP+ reductase